MSPEIEFPPQDDEEYIHSEVKRLNVELEKANIAGDTDKVKQIKADIDALYMLERFVNS